MTWTVSAAPTKTNPALGSGWGAAAAAEDAPSLASYCRLSISERDEDTETGANTFLLQGVQPSPEDPQ